MHVCYLSHTADIREGGERSLLELIRYFHGTRRHSITVLSPPGALPAQLGDFPGVEVVEMKFLRLRRTRNPFLLGGFGISYLRSCLKLRRVVARLDPDVLHCNSATAALYGVLGTSGLGVPVLWHMRDIQPPLPSFRTILPFIGRRAALIVAISRAVAENLVAFGIPRDKIRVVHNAVVPPAVDGRDEFRERLGIGPEQVAMVVLGKLISRKGQMTAVRAMNRIRDRLPSARLVLCGGNDDSPYAASLRRESARLGVEEQVVFAGYQEAGAALAGADLVLVPSEQEPFGRVVAEAMFAARPIVASRVGGVPELIRDGRDGLLVDVGDDAGMAERILRLVEDPALCVRLGETARARARAEFDWSGTGKRIEAVYDELTAPSRSVR